MHASLNVVNREWREERGRRRRRRRDHMKLEEKNGSENIGWIGREGMGGSYQNTLHAYMRFSNNSKYIKSDASFFIFQISKMQAFPPSLGVGESRTVLCKRPASKHQEEVNRRACKRESPYTRFCAAHLIIDIYTTITYSTKDLWLKTGHCEIPLCGFWFSKPWTSCCFMIYMMKMPPTIDLLVQSSWEIKPRHQER